MCSQYWSLTAEVTCPKCEITYTDDDIQTHFMGEVGSCLNHYTLDESIEELQGVSAILDGKNDDFISICPECGKAVLLGAEIVNGKVVRLWNLPSQV